MVSTICKWDGECKLVYGRPRHPQSQGLVEQANGTMEIMIGAYMEQYKTKKWIELLPLIMYNLNTSKSSSTKFTPFEIVFNKKPNVGNQKQFVECDKTGEEKEITDSTMAVDEAALDEAALDKDAVDDVQATTSESVQPSTSSGNVPASNDIEIEDEEDEYEDDEDEQQEIDSKRSQLNKITRDFKLKDLVSVRIPRIDRGGTDFKRMPGMTCKVAKHQEKFWSILTQYGALNDKVRTSDLEPYYSIVDVNFEEFSKAKPFSLKEAATLQSSNTGSVDTVNVICNCGTICLKDGRCKCHKAGKAYTSHCHLKMRKGSKKCCKYV